MKTRTGPSLKAWTVLPNHSIPIVAPSSNTITSTGKKTADNTESGDFTISSVLKLPGKPLNLQMKENFRKQEIQFVVGNFNSHSTSYNDTKLPCSFYIKI